MDYLHQTIDDNKMNALSSLALAHMGDCVYEIITRAYLITSGKVTANALHQATTKIVKASSQAIASKLILPMLTEEEATIFRHGRNAKSKTVPKSASLAEYSHATALEALFGWLYLKGRYDRINELFDIICKETLT